MCVCVCVCVCLCVCVCFGGGETDAGIAAVVRDKKANVVQRPPPSRPLHTSLQGFRSGTDSGTSVGNKEAQNAL